MARGPEAAPVTIVEFSDFECPFCGRAQGTLEALQAAYPEQVRLVFKHFPLAMHRDAPKAAEPAECAGEQGKFWEFHDLLYTRQKALGLEEPIGYGQALGLDAAALRTCVESGRMAERIEADVAQGRALGVTSTPLFYVNGMKVRGAQPIEAFQVLIEAELAG